MEIKRSVARGPVAKNPYVSISMTQTCIHEDEALDGGTMRTHARYWGSPPGVSCNNGSRSLSEIEGLHRQSGPGVRVTPSTPTTPPPHLLQPLTRLSAKWMPVIQSDGP